MCEDGYVAPGASSHETFRESAKSDQLGLNRLDAAVHSAALALPAPLAAAALSARLLVKRALTASCSEVQYSSKLKQLFWD